MPLDFPHSESAVMQALGLSVERFRELRRLWLTMDSHFVKKGRAFVYSGIGVQELCRVLEVEDVLPALLKPPSEAAEPLSEPIVPKLGLVSEFVVARVPPVNKKILLCCLPSENFRAAKNTWVVRVKDNAHYVPGMRIKPRVLAPGLAELTGPGPRWRGKW